MQKRPATDSQHKIVFRLEPDEDGYPPVGYESVWADRLPDGTYRIDNLLWYSYDAAWGDIVSAKEADGELFFDELVSPSGNSLLRVIVYKEDDVPVLINKLKPLGCDCERNGRLVAVNVPAGVDYSPIFQFLMAGQERGSWGFEEAVLGHDSPSRKAFQ
jgi:hypothetical protein